jgi:hypothetical protein
MPAFPGAQGAGSESVGGRGGAVIEVTNLKDSDVGSLRACVSASGPRTCIFRVGGTIVLGSALEIRNPFITIAGQTAPGGGIQLRGAAIAVFDPAHDVVIRYVRSRRGWSSSVPFGTGKGIDLVPVGGGTVYNVIIDHSSFGWQQDDNSTWGAFGAVGTIGVRNGTLQWNVFAEANNPAAFNGTNGRGLLFGAPPNNGYRMGTISLHHNFITSNYMRNPMISGDGPTEVVNNVVYNWGPFGTNTQNRGNGTKVNLIGNYWKKGPASGSRYEFFISEGVGDSKTQPPGLIYVRDNLGPHRTSSAQSEWDFVGMYQAAGVAPASFQKSAAWTLPGFPITASPSQANVDNVLNNVGASLLLNADGTKRSARDAVDSRLVAEYRSGTGSLGGDNNWPVLASGTPPADSDHDGMPDTWETSKGLNPNNAADGNTIAPANSGYTNLEVYLAR